MGWHEWRGLNNAPLNYSIISVAIVCVQTMLRGRGALFPEYERLHLAATMAAPRHPLRSYIVALFRRGDLVSVHEAALICGASRQAISKWIKTEGISIEARRLAHIAKLTTNAQRYLDGLPPLRKPTKAQMRKTLDDAMRRFNAANAAKAI